MPFCPKCGTEYQAGTKFCAKCGSNLDGSVAPVPVNREPDFFTKLMNTKDVTSTINPADISANKVMAILCYCGSLAYLLLYLLDLLPWNSLFCLLVSAGLMIAPILMAKNSPFIRFHLSQSLIGLFALMIVQTIDSPVTSSVYWALARVGMDYTWTGVEYNIGMVILAFFVTWIIHIVLCGIPAFMLVMGLINAIQGKAKEMPLLGRFGLKI